MTISQLKAQAKTWTPPKLYGFLGAVLMASLTVFLQPIAYMVDRGWTNDGFVWYFSLWWTACIVGLPGLFCRLCGWDWSKAVSMTMTQFMAAVVINALIGLVVGLMLGSAIALLRSFKRRKQL